MNNSFFKFHKWFKGTLVFLTLGSTAFTFRGLIAAIDSADEWALFLAIIQCLITFIFSVLGWLFFFEATPKASAVQRKQLIVGLMIFLLIIFSTSSYFGTVGLVGNITRDRHLTIKTKEADIAFVGHIQKRKEIAMLIPSIVSNKSVFESATNRELNGYYSRKAGSGKISGTIKGMVDGYARIEEKLNIYNRKTDRLFAKGTRYLDDIRFTINDHTLTVDQKYQQVGNKYSEINKLFIELDEPIVPSLVAEVERLDRLYISDSDPEVKAVMDKLRTPIEEAKSLFMERAASIRDKRISTPQFYSIGALEAIAMYPIYSWPYLLYALTTDFIAPLGMLLILTYLASGFRSSNGGMRSGGAGSHRMPPKRQPAMPVRPPMPVYAAKEEAKTNNSNSNGGNGKDHNGGNGKDKTHDQPTDFQV